MNVFKYIGTVDVLPTIAVSDGDVCTLHGDEYIRCGGEWIIAGLQEPEIKQIKPLPTTCERCGAPLNHGKCEYCGTDYRF